MEERVDLTLEIEHDKKKKKGSYKITMEFVVDDVVEAVKYIDNDFGGTYDDLCYETLKIGLNAITDRRVYTQVFVNFNCKRTEWLDRLVKSFNNIYFLKIEDKGEM